MKLTPLALHVTDFLEEVQLTALPPHTLISGIPLVPQCREQYLLLQGQTTELGIL